MLLLLKTSSNVLSDSQETSVIEDCDMAFASPLAAAAQAKKNI